MHILQAEAVTKQFTGHRALDKVSVHVPQGSIYGLLGPNGAGKTTLIRIINRITAPDEGRILFDGRNIRSGDIHQIGYLPEERGLYRKMKVGEQAMYLARLKGLSKNDARDKLNYWFEKFEIEAWWNKKVEELSKGMQQKVQFITTILHEPKLLIFDEPFSGFDPINAEILKQEVLKLREQGATIIFSTHNMTSVEELCDHITLINQAKTILEGHIQDIRNRYKSDIYEVIFEGKAEDIERALNSGYELLDHHRDPQTQYITAKIKLKQKTKENALLNLLIPGVHIIEFRELVPGMNEIFIKVVREYQKEPVS